MADATLDLLIQIRDRLDGLDNTRKGIKETKQEAEGLGNVIKSGLGIGSGIEIASRTLDLLTNSIRATVGEAFTYADQIRDLSRNLTIGVEGLQVLDDLVNDTGGDLTVLTNSIKEQNKVLAEAKRGGAGAAEAYRLLNLEVGAMEGMTVERRFEAIARAVEDSEDKTSALIAVQKILGTDNAPQLEEALRRLARDGYDVVRDAAVDAGKVMEEDTIQRLANAQKNLDNLRRQAVILAGETVGLGAGIVEAAQADGGGTLSDVMRWVMGGGPSNLALRLAGDGSGGNNSRPAPGLSARDQQINALQYQMLNRQLEMAEKVADVTKTESDIRADVVDLLNEQASLLEQIHDLEFSDVIGLDESGNITPEQLNRLRQANALIKEANGLRQQAKGLQTGGVSTTALIDERFQGMNDPAVNPGFIGAGDGFTAGLQSWAVATGSVGQQIAQTLQSTVGGAVSTLSTGINGLVTGTQKWGDVGRSVMAMLLQELIKLTVQQLIFRSIMGAFGSAITPATPTAPLPGRATGGDVAPGNLYRVNEHNFAEYFTPSVPGRISPSVPLGESRAGNGRNGDRPVTVNLALNVSTGVADTVRAEMVGFTPQLKAIAKQAVREGIARGEIEG